MKQAYMLRADGALHTADVRHLSCTNIGLLLTASRDNTAGVAVLPDGDVITIGTVLVGHTAFVNFVFFHPGISLLGGDPCIVTGSNDTHVALWSVDSMQVEAVLDGHNHGVCCGALLQSVPASTSEIEWSGDIVTGDWGGLCLVFDHVSGRAKQTYDKHKTAIRGVTQLPGTDCVVSCSGDMTIHLWNVVRGDTLQIFKGHIDVVQCICAIDPTTFATGSNDCTIRIWQVGRQMPIQVITDHDSLVYTLSWNSTDNELLSASEDRTTKIWGRRPAAQLGDKKSADEFCLTQSIHHPCVVWAVAATADGDIATGGSDGVVRLWTKDETRSASPEKLVAFDDSLSAQRIDVKVANETGLDLSKLLMVDDLRHHQGQKDGERCFVKTTTGTVELHVWSLGRWEKVGDVVAGPDQQAYTGAPTARENRLHNGVAYDYLFNVDVNGRMLMLPYNAGQSVFDAAQRFIDSHQPTVSQDSKEEIQKFILQNIDPDDVRRIPGASLGDRSGVGGEGFAPSGDVAVSSYAREAAQLPEGGVGTWQEILHRMEAAGEGTQTAPLSASARESLPSDVEKQQLPSQTTCASSGAATKVGYECFSTFNAEAAQKKIRELTAGDPLYANIIEEVGVLATSTEEDWRTACDRLVGLFHQLPHTLRFPAIDVIRYMVVKTTIPTAPLVVLDTLVPAFHEWRSSGVGETLVTLRLTANILATLGNSDAHALSSAGGSLLARLCSTLPFLDDPSSFTPAVQAAAVAVLHNACVLLQRTGEKHALSNSARQDLAKGLATSSSQWLLSGIGGPSVLTMLLSTLLTVFGLEETPASGWVHEISVQLTPVVRVLVSGGSPAISQLARDLLQLLNAPLTK